MRNKIFLLLLIPLYLTSFILVDAQTTQTEVIIEDQTPDPIPPDIVIPDDVWGLWIIEGRSNPYEFIDSNPSIGDGSLYMLPYLESDAGSIDKLRMSIFMEQSISELNQSSYDFKIGQGGTSADASRFYTNYYVNFGESSNNTFFNYDCNYVLAPTTGSTDEYTTVVFDPTNSYPVTTSGDSPYPCPAVPADMDSIEPGSYITNIGYQIDTDLGSNKAEEGFDGYFDNIVLDTTERKTIYDFEKSFPAPQSESSVSSSSGQRIRFACNDPEASNYSRFGRHNESLCKYNEREPTDTTFDQCSSNLMVTDNMQQGDHNDRKSGYNQGNIVSQVMLLQYHINRLLPEEYSVTLDGIFGSQTYQGVQRLQTRLNTLIPGLNLTIDGIVGPNTKAAINTSC